MSRESDPGDRVPYSNSHGRLKYEDVIPDVELKAKIDAWVAEGSVPAQGSAMDVDA